MRGGRGKGVDGHHGLIDGGFDTETCRALDKPITRTALRDMTVTTESRVECFSLAPPGGSFSHRHQRRSHLTLSWRPSHPRPGPSVAGHWSGSRGLSHPAQPSVAAALGALVNYSHCILSSSRPGVKWADMEVQSSADFSPTVPDLGLVDCRLLALGNLESHGDNQGGFIRVTVL
ncbi:hypothetical protein RRG08_038235 [Elysia crispata]|uniref:Uncharacterized protein n=1 Tax=Elysia crispata TaxID=231223 RepID=A0AAE1AN16_9GAST|nr:hypothetical protein RRG08_038235 [Elysia crispata]